MTELTPMPAASTGAELSIFNYTDGQQVRAVSVEDDPWFVVSDVAKILGYRDANTASRILREHHKGYAEVRTPGGSQNMLVTSEKGLYRLILRSSTQDAERVQDWVTDEVLPAIRRTGQYTAPSAQVEVKPQSTLDVLAAVVAEMQRVERETRETARHAEAVALEASTAASTVANRLDAIEGRHDWWAALGYAKEFGLSTDQATANRLGRIAARIGRRDGIKPNKVQHALFGRVNQFPRYIWDEAALELD